MRNRLILIVAAAACGCGRAPSASPPVAPLAVTPAIPLDNPRQPAMMPPACVAPAIEFVGPPAPPATGQVESDPVPPPPPPSPVPYRP